MKLVKFLFVFFFFSIMIANSSFIANLYAWPVGGGNWPTEIESDFGPRGTTGFHHGVDFAIPVGTSVIAERSGNVTRKGWENSANHAQGFGYRIYIGNDIYAHLVDDTIPNDPYPSLVTIGQWVDVGTPIGWSGNTGHSSGPHLHFQIPEGNPLSIFNYTHTNPAISYIRAEINGASYTTVYSTTTLHTYIETTNKDLDIIRFSLDPPQIGFPITFDYHNWNIQPGMRYNSWCDNQDPAQDHFYYDWNTRLNSAGTGEANINSEARFPDGRVEVEVSAFDIWNDSVSLSGIITVDNFRPYVHQATITQNGEQKYNAYWNWNGTYLILTPDTQKGRNPSPLASGNASITILFSEPVEDATLSIDTFGSISLSSSESGNGQKTFTGTLNIPSGNSSHDGKRTMTISAKDLAGNQILQIASGTTQINPATQLTRDSSGNMQGTGGNDTLHQFIIGTGAPTVSITSPSDGDILDHSAVDVTGIATDDISVVSVTVNGVTAELTPSGGGVSVSFKATVTLSEGIDQAIEAIATDGDGKTANDTVNVTVDLTPPSVGNVVVDPNPTEVGCPTALTATATDGVTKIVAAEFFIDEDNPDEGNGIGMSVGTGNVGDPIALQGVIDISILPIGSHTVSVRAKDEAGHWSSVGKTDFDILNAEDPIISISSPAEGDIFDHADIAVNGTATDNVWVEKVKVNNVVAGLTPSGGKAVIFDATVTLSEGRDQSIEAEAWDKAENSSTDTVHVIVDLTPPDVTNVKVDPNPTDVGSDPTLTATATDKVTNIVAAEFFVDGPDPGEGNGMAMSVGTGNIGDSIALEGTIDVSGLSIGHYTVYVRAKDEAGHWTTPAAGTDFEIVDVIVDITSPAEGDIFDHADIDVSGTAEDNVWVEKVSVNGVNAELYPTGGEKYVDFTATVTLSEGRDQSIEAEAWDKAGNSSTDSVHVIVDLTPPDVTNVKVDPNPTKSNNNPDLTAVATDGITDIVAAEFFIDGSDPGEGAGIGMSVGTGDIGDPIALDGVIDVSGLSIGMHTVYVRAKDEAGWWTDPVVGADFEVIDAEPPVVNILVPKDGDKFNHSNISVWGAAEDNVWVDAVKVNGVDAKLIPPAGGEAISYVATVNLPEGKDQPIVAIAWDTSGNQSDPAEVKVTVDTTPPDIYISIPDGKGFYRPHPPVKAWYTLSDNLDPNPRTVKAIGVALWPSYVIYNINALPNGSYPLVVIAKDWVGNESQKTHTFHIANRPPPDDNYSISDGTPYSIEQNFSDKCKVGVLNGGLVGSLTSLLTELGEKYRLIDIPIDIDLLKQYPVLIIPSSGISDYSNSSSLKESLEEYVDIGGVIFSLTQERGYDFNILPSGEFNGVGFLEDKGCFTYAGGIETQHVIFSGQEDVYIDANVDGYLTQWPVNSKILMRRTKNSMPFLIEYDYGKGKVIASSLYSDYGYIASQVTETEKDLIRDLISWAKCPSSEILQYKEGDLVTGQVTLSSSENNTAEVTQVDINICSPDKDLLITNNYQLSEPLLAGLSTDVDYSYQIGSVSPDLGIYWVNYVLKNVNGEVVQEETLGKRFAVHKEIGTVNLCKDINIVIKSTEEVYPIGGTAIFEVTLSNERDTDAQVEVKPSFSYHWSSEAGSLISKVIPGKDSVTFNLELTDVSQGDWLTCRVYEQGKLLATAQEWFLVFHPAVDVSLKLEKNLYNLGEEGELILVLRNKQNADYPVDVEVGVIDSENNKIWEGSLNCSLSAGESKSEIINFVVPEDAIKGIYLISVEVYRLGGKIGSGLVYFEVPQVQLSVESILPESLSVTSSKKVSFLITNSGATNVGEGRLEVKLEDPDKESVFNQTKEFSLLAGENITIDFDVSLTEVKFGDYRLSNYLTTEDGLNSQGGVTIPCFVTAKASFDKLMYKIRGNLSFNLEVTNTGKIEQPLEITANIPSCGFTNISNVILSANQTTIIPYELTIPDTGSAGTNNVEVKLNMANELTKNFSFIIQPSKLVMSLDKIEYTIGETGQVKVENQGGVDTEYDDTLKIIDMENNVLFEGSGSDSLRWGEYKMIDFSLSDSQVISGQYRVSVVINEERFNKKTTFERYIKISGLSATISLSTDKGAYLTDEAIVANANITPSDGAISEGILSLKVYTPEENWLNYSELEGTTCIVVEKENIWFGTDSGKLVRYDKTNKSYSDYLLPLGEGWEKYVYALAVDGEYVWVGNRSGLARWDKTNQEWKTYSREQGLSSNVVLSLTNDGSYMWVGTGQGLDRLNKITDDFEYWTTYEGLVSNQIISLALDSNYLWIGTFKGVNRLNKIDNNMETFTTGNGLVDNRVRFISVEEKNVWFATLGGISRFNKEDNTWQAFTELDGLANNEVFSISLDGDDIWFATKEGACKYNKLTDSWKTYTTDDGLVSNCVRIVIVDGDEVWFITGEAI